MSYIDTLGQAVRSRASHLIRPDKWDETFGLVPGTTEEAIRQIKTAIPPAVAPVSDACTEGGGK